MNSGKILDATNKKLNTKKSVVNNVKPPVDESTKLAVDKCEAFPPLPTNTTEVFLQVPAIPRKENVIRTILMFND